jgi:hypothetical protein
MSSRALVVVLVLPVACGSPRLGRLATGVEVASTTLAFPRAYVGRSSSVELRVRNSGSADADVSMTASAPFAAPAVVRVAAGETAYVPVTLEAPSPGPVTGLLTLRDDTRLLLVRLVANVKVVPSCVDFNECQVAEFDTVVGSCVARPQLDGVACRGGGCLAEARCVGGRCLGTPLDRDASRLLRWRCLHGRRLSPGRGLRSRAGRLSSTGRPVSGPGVRPEPRLHQCARGRRHAVRSCGLPDRAGVPRRPLRRGPDAGGRRVCTGDTLRGRRRVPCGRVRTARGQRAHAGVERGSRARAGPALPRPR